MEDKNLNKLFKQTCKNNLLYKKYENYFDTATATFRKIISLKDYRKMNEKEKEDFYFEYDIYVDKTKKINPALIDDIITSYLYYSSPAWEATGEKAIIENKINTCIDDTQKTKLIKKEYTKYAKKLNKISLYIEYSFSNKNNIPISQTDSFLEEVSNQITDTIKRCIDDYIIGNILEKHITSNKTYFRDYYLFMEWDNIEVYKNVLEYLKDYQEKLITSDLSTQTQLSVSQQIILLDEIRLITPVNWESYHDTKKAELISLLLGKSEQNIRTKLPLLSKPQSKAPEKFIQDVEYIQDILKRILKD